MNNIYSLVRPYYFKDYTKYDKSIILPLILTLIVSFINSFISLFFMRVCSNVDCIINIRTIIIIVNIFVSLIDLYGIKMSFANKKYSYTHTIIIFFEVLSSLVLAIECFTFWNRALENGLEIYFPFLLVLCNMIRLLRGKGFYSFLFITITVIEAYIVLPVIILHFDSEYLLLESLKESFPDLMRAIPFLGEYLLRIINL